MGALIDDMLYFIKIGKREIKKAQVDMTALVNEAINEVNKESDVKYTAKIVIKDLPPAHCDYYLMLRAFWHLLSNALKFSRTRPDAVIEIGAQPDNDMMTYYVKDNGRGFDMRYYNKLFGVFQRLEAIDDFPGTGMGLATVKKIALRHGGKVAADGKLNEGATFYISLPIMATE
jgi:light-regulated signal transduction histidine kinase (bacteriophytochrome)